MWSGKPCFRVISNSELNVDQIPRRQNHQSPVNLSERQHLVSECSRSGASWPRPAEPSNTKLLKPVPVITSQQVSLNRCPWWSPPPSLPSGHYSCVWPPQELPGQPGEEDGGQAGAGHHRLQVRPDQEEALPLRLHLQLGAAAGARYTRNFDFPNDQADARIESTKCNSF